MIFTASGTTRILPRAGWNLARVGTSSNWQLNNKITSSVTAITGLGSRAAQPPGQRCAAGRLRCNITTGRMTLLVHRNKDGSQVSMAEMRTAGNSVDILARQPAAARLLDYDYRREGR